jgi:hypothetical protein
VLEVLDRYIYESVAEQRVAKLEASMHASRRATSTRRRLATALIAAARRLDPPSARAQQPCPEPMAGRS